MRRKRTDRCVICQATAADRADLSYRGLCLSCGLERVAAWQTQLHAKAGPLYEQWLATQPMPPAS